MIMRRCRTSFAERAVISADGDRSIKISYGRLMARADRLAWALEKFGLARGDRIASLGWNHHRHLELYFAATASGYVLHTINPRLHPNQIRDIVQHAGDKILFFDADTADVSAELLRSGMIDTAICFEVGSSAFATDILDYEEVLKQQQDALYEYPSDLGEHDQAALCYTSATTGRPKGVAYTHRAIVLHALMLGLADTWSISEADSILPIVPMFHVNAWGLPFAAAWFGSKLVLPGPRPSAAQCLRLMQEHGVTFSAAVPTVWTEVLRTMRASEVRLDAARLFVSGGAPLSPQLLAEADALGVPLIQSYGMTEASPLVLVSRPRTGVPSSVLDHVRTWQGYVVPGVEFRVRTPDREDVAWDGKTVGELELRGPWIAERYEDDGRSGETFADGWYRTGDMVQIDAYGYLRLVDRKSDLIKSGGEWISTIDLESALLDHPAIESAAVVGVEDEVWQERPHAFVVMRDDVPLAEIHRHLESRVPRYWLPDRIFKVDTIPLTAVGKYDKQSLRRSQVEGNEPVEIA